MNNENVDSEREYRQRRITRRIGWGERERMKKRKRNNNKRFVHHFFFVFKSK